MKKKLKFILPVVVLLLGGAAYKTVLKKKVPLAKPKIAGTLVQLQPEFVVNLGGGRYGKFTVALDMPAPPVAGKDASGPVMPKENDAVRAIITDEVTGAPAGDLITPLGRHRLVARLLKDFKTETDEKVENVYFTDIAVQ